LFKPRLKPASPLTWGSDWDQQAATGITTIQLGITKIRVQARVIEGITDNTGVKR
jgi:hypothetical protein